MKNKQGTPPDRKTVSDIVVERQGSLIRYARGIVGDSERAKDVVQDTFLKLCRQPWEEVKGHLVPWLFRVTRNNALDALRKEKRMSLYERPESAISTEPVGHRSNQEDVRQDTAGSLLDLVQQMPEKQREVILLKFQQDLSYKEISEVTGMSVSNVGYVMHHAIKDLKERWKEAESA